MTIRTKPKPAGMLLILGAGWTSTFLLPLLAASSIPHAATSTTGRRGTINFTFDPSSSDPSPYGRLPDARLILITFPLQGAGQSQHLVAMYAATHPHARDVAYVQLGSSAVFTAPHWNTCASAYDRCGARAVAEDELRALGGCVLELAGLYGGGREPRAWARRVAGTKEQVRAKKALHLVHGVDVARAVVAVYGDFTEGKRWLLTDLYVYDWWDLFVEWGGEAEEKKKKKGKDLVEAGEDASEELPYRRWVLECMDEEGVRALPRDTTSLGRVLDSRDFWKHFGMWPSQGRMK